MVQQMLRQKSTVWKGVLYFAVYETLPTATCKNMSSHVTAARTLSSAWVCCLQQCVWHYLITQVTSTKHMTAD